MHTDELAERLFGSVLGALDVLTVHIGDQLGLYELLHRSGPLTVAGLIETECVHDMPDPVSVLGGTRRMVREGGTVLVTDERVPETFAGPGDPVEVLPSGQLRPTLDDLG